MFYEYNEYRGGSGLGGIQMEGHSICPLPEKKQSVSHIEKRCVEELRQQCFDHELQHGYLVLKHVEGTKRLAEG